MVDTRDNPCSEHNSTDEELVRLFLESQDNRYFQKLYERYAVKVYQKCVKLTRDSDRAEDITHDVFLKLINKMSTFKTGAKFSTWLFTITYNHCMDLVRFRKRNVILIHQEASEIEECEEITVHGLLDEEVDLVSLKDALDQLQVHEKAMIYLRYLDDRSVRDIARLFQTSESAVKMRLMRCRKKLRMCYHKLSGGSDFF